MTPELEAFMERRREEIFKRQDDAMMNAIFLGMDHGSKDASAVVTAQQGANGTITISDIDHMADALAKAFPPPRWAESAILSAEAVRNVEPGPMVWQNPLQEPSISVFGGIKISSNPAFPMILDCSVCDRTGEGTESTYCESCQGYGENVIDGMITNGRGSMMLLKGPHRGKKKFEPYFPAGLVPEPPLCRGLA